MSRLTMLPGAGMAPTDAEVLGVLSHELRTPLTILAGLHDLLTETAAASLTPDQRDYLVTIGTTIDQLAHVVEDVLAATSLRSQLPTLRREALVVEPLLADVVACHMAQAESLHVGLHASVPAPLPAVHADGDRVGQVVSRLVENALAFAREGSEVTIHATSSPSEVLIGVEDFGPGIKEDDMVRLFQPFSQLDMSTTRAHAGLGVGLFLCRRWVEAHGGHIGVVSHLGHGSTFWFTLPTAA